MSEPIPVPPRSHALARWPMVVAGGVLLAAGYGLTAFSLWPRAAHQSKAAAIADTTAMADLRAVEAILETAQRAMVTGDLAKARTVLESAVAQYERDQALRLALADLFVRLSRPPPDDTGPEDEPIGDAEQRAFTRAAYEQFLAALAIGPRAAEVEFAAGSLARDLGDTGAAIAHFQSASALDRSNGNYPLHLAQVLFASDDLAAAHAQLAIAVRLNPDEARAWGMMAEIALRQGSPRLALGHLERATALEPRAPAWRHMQARAFSRVSQPDDALKALDALTERDRLGRTALLLAGQAYGLAGQPAQALARYESALSFGVEDMRIFLDAATWAERIGQRARAIELARTAAMAQVEGARRMLDRLESDPAPPAPEP